MTGGQYRSRAMASVHEAAKDLHAVGIMDRRTMRQFDAACLTTVRAPAGNGKRALPKRTSQAAFARYLNVTKGLVSQ